MGIRTCDVEFFRISHVGIKRVHRNNLKNASCDEDKKMISRCDIKVVSQMIKEVSQMLPPLPN
jgi:hypothetical protein